MRPGVVTCASAVPAAPGAGASTRSPSRRILGQKPGDAVARVVHVVEAHARTREPEGVHLVVVCRAHGPYSYGCATNARRLEEGSNEAQVEAADVGHGEDAVNRVALKCLPKARNEALEGGLARLGRVGGREVAAYEGVLVVGEVVREGAVVDGAGKEVFELRGVAPVPPEKPWKLGRDRAWPLLPRGLPGHRARASSTRGRRGRVASGDARTPRERRLARTRAWPSPSNANRHGPRDFEGTVFPS